jgi:hypothetical protein
MLMMFICWKMKNTEINVDKTDNMLLSRHQNGGQNHGIKTANRSFENVAQFKYFGTTEQNQNVIQEGIERRLNSGIACCYLVQKLQASCLLYNINIRIYKTATFPLVPYECQPCSLA